MATTLLRRSLRSVSIQDGLDSVDAIRSRRSRASVAAATSASESRRATRAASANCESGRVMLLASWTKRMCQRAAARVVSLWGSPGNQERFGDGDPQVVALSLFLRDTSRLGSGPNHRPSRRTSGAPESTATSSGFKRSSAPCASSAASRSFRLRRSRPPRRSARARTRSPSRRWNDKDSTVGVHPHSPWVRARTAAGGAIVSSSRFTAAR